MGIVLATSNLLKLEKSPYFKRAWKNFRPTDFCRFCSIPQRWILAFLMNLGFAILFGIRCNIGAAKAQNSTTMDLNFTSGASLGNDTIVNNSVAPFHFWNHHIQGLLVSSIFYGTLILQLPGGIICTKYSPKLIFGLSIGITSLLNVLMPLAVSWHYASAIIVHFLQGVLFGVAFPASFQMWKFWAPPLEKSRLITTSICGNYIGVVVGMPLSATLITHANWQAPFYAYGVLGLIWLILWISMTSDKPGNHVAISEKEKCYIQDSIGFDGSAEIKIKSIPWKNICMSKALWAIVFSAFCRNWTLYIYKIYSLSFMKEVLDIELQEAGFWASISYTTMTLTVLLGGRLADFVIIKKWLTVVRVRKVFNSTGFLGEAAFLCIVAFSTNKTVAVGCLILAATMSGFSLSGFSVNQMDIGPKYAGVLMGLSNGLCNLSGVVGPVLIEYLTRNYGQFGWRLCFLISCGLHVSGVLVYLFWASGDEQDWSTADEEGKSKISKEKC